MRLPDRVVHLVAKQLHIPIVDNANVRNSTGPHTTGSPSSVWVCPTCFYVLIASPRDQDIDAGPHTLPLPLSQPLVEA